jgi:hypothetical protein
MAENKLTNDNIASNAAIATTKLGAGAVVQVVNTMDVTKKTGTTQLPIDDTIPQITEGDEYMTCSITPKSTTNKLLIQVVAYASPSAADNMGIALFQDATANALNSFVFYVATATAIFPFTINHYMAAGTTSATTFRVRIGRGTTGATTTFNGSNGSRLMGGSMGSSITITEIAV